jgi:hypothetical protein
VSEPEQVAAEPADVIQSWQFCGLILPATGETGPRVKGGTVTRAELQRFVDRVANEMPDATIVIHEYGLRAIYSASSHRADGPKLDWSDWT